MQRYAVTGAPLGAPVQVDSLAERAQAQPSLVAIVDGFVLSWQSYEVPVPGVFEDRGPHAVVLDHEARPRTPSFPLLESGGEGRFGARLASAGGLEVVGVWEGDGGATEGDREVLARLYGRILSATEIPTLDGLGMLALGGILAVIAVAMLAARRKRSEGGGLPGTDDL